MMQASELTHRLETWLAYAEEHSEIPAAEADWRRNLLKTAQQIEVCKELIGSQAEKDLREAVAIARVGDLASFELVRELFQRVLLEMRSGRIA
jgi:hypothetical protein